MINKIVLADAFNLSENAYEELAFIGEVVRCDLGNRPGLFASVHDADVIVAEYARIDRELMDAAPRLKGIVVYGVGKDHIDLAAAAERGIKILNTAGANAGAVAELTFAVLLNCIRRVRQADQYIRDGRWQCGESASLPDSFHGTELAGKSIGVIGYGNIGRRIAGIARGFGMLPYYWEPNFVEADIPFLSLEKLISSVDVLSVNCPLNKESRGLLSRQRLLGTKKGVVLIVTSRGNIVDEEALAELLVSGHIAAAGLDVFSSEPLPADSPLLRAPNTLFTPHIGGSTHEAEANISRMIVSNCKAILN
jgi:D-3-phosphoglycerate dehydrogenase